MNIVQIKRNDSAYDKVRKYKKEPIRYISKKRFKSLECDEKNIQGFFYFRKSRTENIIQTEKNSFDLFKERPSFSVVRGYVKGNDNNYYGIIRPNFLPFILLIAMLFCLFTMFHPNELTVDDEPWNPVIEQFTDFDETTEESERKQITICGFTEWNVKAGETGNLPISLKNPEGNPCYFTFIITLEDGTVLFQSDYVPPGNEIKRITINESLEKGTYTAFVSILTNELETGAKMNSADTKITINVV